MIIVSFFQQGNGRIIHDTRPWYLGKCEVGTAVGGSEKMLRFKYTVQQCIDSVRLEYPAANGFTMNYPCDYPTKCNCYAIIGMESWKINHQHQGFKTCRFNDKGKYISVNSVVLRCR